jgi:hypothetical protein
MATSPHYIVSARTVQKTAFPSVTCYTAVYLAPQFLLSVNVPHYSLDKAVRPEDGGCWFVTFPFVIGREYAGVPDAPTALALKPLVVFSFFF